MGLIDSFIYGISCFISFYIPIFFHLLYGLICMKISKLGDYFILYIFLYSFDKSSQKIMKQKKKEDLKKT